MVCRQVSVVVICWSIKNWVLTDCYNEFTLCVQLLWVSFSHNSKSLLKVPKISMFGYWFLNIRHWHQSLKTIVWRVIQTIVFSVAFPLPLFAYIDSKILEKALNKKEAILSVIVVGVNTMFWCYLIMYSLFRNVLPVVWSNDSPSSQLIEESINILSRSFLFTDST